MPDPYIHEIIEADGSVTGTQTVYVTQDPAGYLVVADSASNAPLHTSDEAKVLTKAGTSLYVEDCVLMTCVAVQEGVVPDDMLEALQDVINVRRSRFLEHRRG